MEVENRFDGVDGVDDYAIKLIRYKARQLTRMAGFSESDRSDLEQELMFDLLRRLPKYDAAKAKRTTFVARVLEHCASRLIEARLAEKRAPCREDGSLDERIESECGSVARAHTIDQEDYWRQLHGVSRSLAELEDLRLDLAAERPGLTPRLLEVFDELKAYRITEIADRLDISRRSVYEAITRLRDRLEDTGLKEYL